MWSWGHYLSCVIADPAYTAEKNPERIADRIDKIREAMTATGCPKWLDVELLIGRHGEVTDRFFRERMREWVVLTAEKAGLPVLKETGSVFDAIEFFRDAFQEGMEKALDYPVWPLWHFAEWVAHSVASDVVFRLRSAICVIRERKLAQVGVGWIWLRAAVGDSSRPRVL